MKQLDISIRLLSEALWKRIFEHSSSQYLAQREIFFSDVGDLDNLRVKAEINTGSISTSSQWALFALAHLTSPKYVLEVGTYIGKSTTALAKGIDSAGLIGELHTCDMSNSVELPLRTNTKIIQYPLTSSTQMLCDLIELDYKHKFELLYLDGRLSTDDLHLIGQLCAPSAIVAVDDFEGIEKGVANISNFRSAGVFKEHTLITPPSESLLGRYGFWDHCSTALLVHPALIRFTAQ